MKIIDSKNNEIKTFEDWYELIIKGKKEKQWKPERSAQSLAKFMLHNDGAVFIENLIAGLLDEQVTLSYGLPEMEQKFDRYGHGREHDLGVFGETASGKKIFIGLEAKVDETFDELIVDRYLRTKSNELNGESTNAPKRIEELLKRQFNKVSSKHFQLRYQLLHATVGTLAVEADISIFLVIVFKTDDYNHSKGKKNHNDYMRFVKSLNSKPFDFKASYDTHEAIIENKKLYMIYTHMDS